ncbi:MAG: carbohydrate-binding domain-containing protein, partial [Janthinobacterium lividum]
TNLMGGIAAATAALPGKPVQITETGISSAAVAGQTWGTAGDEYTQGLIDTNAVLDTFKGGATRTYLYNLMDNQSAADLEDNFGLFNADGTAKAAATDLHNLTTILADSGATAASFALSTPGFVLPTLPAGASSMLLQKASGTYDLVLWNSSATVWSGTTEVTPTPVAVTMPLAGTYSSVKVYDVATGATPTQTLANASSVSLSLGKEPMVVEIAGLVPVVTPVVTPTTGCAAAATDTLRITTSEDAYLGDAQFTVSVDGKLVGTYSATASHAAGKTSDLVLTGTWSTGAHTVAVAFLNDAYGGSAALDRNLYVAKVTYDGVASTGAAQELPWDETATWAVGQ